MQAFPDNAESYRNMVTDIEADRDMSVIEAIVERRLRIPGFAEWWSENTADYDTGFVGRVESLKRNPDH